MRGHAQLKYPYGDGCVGRLDKGATGLLLFTQSGALDARLAVPEARVPKEYALRLAAPLAPPQFERAAARGRSGARRRRRGAACGAAPRRGRRSRAGAPARDGGVAPPRVQAAWGAELQHEAVGGLRLDALALAPGEWRALGRAQLQAVLAPIENT